MSGYIGTQPVPQATQTRQTFTATSGQTSFATLGYTPNFVDVYLNGVHLLNGTDYTATNGSDIVLTSGAATGDVLEMLAYSTFEVNSQNFTGDTTVANLDVTGTFTGTNLTLSGGVYLGGTGAANLLDDYETGSFSPDLKDNDGTFLSASSQGRYTKVGDLVYITIEIYANGVSNHTSNGSPYFLLPFSADSKTNGTFLPNYYGGTGTVNSGYINSGAADRLVLAVSRDEPFGNSANGAVFGGNVRLYGSIVYRV